MTDKKISALDTLGSISAADLMVVVDVTDLTKTYKATVQEIYQAGGGSGAVGGTTIANDPIWQAAGDLAVGTGASAAARLAKGGANQILAMNSAASGLEWISGSIAGSSAFVAKSLFDAQTILAATSDNTPAALTVGTNTFVGRAAGNIEALAVAEQTLLGRITGGNLVALNVSQIQTLAFSAALPENISITLDQSLSADGTYSGITEIGTAGAALSFGNSIFYNGLESRWWLTDADSAASSSGKIGICVAAASDGGSTRILLAGKVRADAIFPTFSTGSPVFLSQTPGILTNTAPSSAGNIIRIIGYGNDGNELYFYPDNTFLEHA
jgi:hypothetical protein